VGEQPDQVLSAVASAVFSALALALSAMGLYLQWRDRRPALEIRVRYEYRVRDEPGAPGNNDAPPRMHDDSQEGLYLLLGDFLKEHGLGYRQGSPVVRLSLSNGGARTVYLQSARLVLHNRRVLGFPRRDRLVLDPKRDRVLPLGLAQGHANVLDPKGEGRLPVELAPGDGAGYRFELTRLANALRKEGYEGDVRLAVEATDRLGNTWRRPFGVNVDLWAYREER
jgi:hypothetical protein